MSRLIRRKFQIQANRRSQSDTRSQVDLTSLIKEKERILGIKVAREKYHLLVEEEMIAAAVMRNLIKESHGILKAAGKLMYLQETAHRSRLTIGKG